MHKHLLAAALAFTLAAPAWAGKPAPASPPPSSQKPVDMNTWTPGAEPEAPSDPKAPANANGGGDEGEVETKKKVKLVRKKAAGISFLAPKGWNVKEETGSITLTKDPNDGDSPFIVLFVDDDDGTPAEKLAKSTLKNLGEKYKVDNEGKDPEDPTYFLLQAHETVKKKTDDAVVFVAVDPESKLAFTAVMNAERSAFQELGGHELLLKFMKSLKPVEKTTKKKKKKAVKE